MNPVMLPYPACMSWPVPEPGVCVEAWQDGRCGFCGTARRPLVMDHSHVDGRERGLLCRSCNAIEARSGHPKWTMYRAGWNPASLTGNDEEYVSAFGETAIYTKVDDSKRRAAIDGLPRPDVA